MVWVYDRTARNPLRRGPLAVACYSHIHVVLYRTRSTVLIFIRFPRKTPDNVVRLQWVGAGRLPCRVTNLLVGYPKMWEKKKFPYPLERSRTTVFCYYNRTRGSFVHSHDECRILSAMIIIYYTLWEIVCATSATRDILYACSSNAIFYYSRLFVPPP